MSARDVKAALDRAGVPSARLAWPAGSAPPLPWAVFWLEESDGQPADSREWAAAGRWVVELYQRSPDASLEARVEAELSAAADGTLSKSEAWVDPESCSQTTYRFKVFERQEARQWAR